MKIPHGTPTPGRPQSNSQTESYVRVVVEGTKQYFIAQASLDSTGHTPLDMLVILLIVKLRMERQHGAYGIKLAQTGIGATGIILSTHWVAWLIFVHVRLS